MLDRREGFISLLIGDDSNVVGGEPATLVAKQPVPPTCLEPSKDLDNISFAKGQRGIILRLVVIESPAEEGGDVLLVVLAVGISKGGGHRRDGSRSVGSPVLWEIM